MTNSLTYILDVLCWNPGCGLRNLTQVFHGLPYSRGISWNNFCKWAQSLSVTYLPRYAAYVSTVKQTRKYFRHWKWNTRRECQLAHKGIERPCYSSVNYALASHWLGGVRSRMTSLETDGRRRKFPLRILDFAGKCYSAAETCTAPRDQRV